MKILTLLYSATLTFLILGNLYQATLIQTQSHIHTLRSTHQMNNPFSSHPVERNLGDEIALNNEDFYDPRTSDLAGFISQLEEKYDGESGISINTRLNTDSSYTTGNADQPEEVESLLPEFDIPVKERSLQEELDKHMTFMKNVFNSLNLDIFSEDPKTFLGDHDVYFKIVKKRSLIFYYLSRIIFYGTIVVLMMKYFSTKVKKQYMVNFEDKDQDNYKNYKAEYKRFMIFQSISVISVVFLSLVFFFMVSSPKNTIDDVASELLYEYRKIKSIVLDVSNHIEEINEKKVRVYIDENYKFYAIKNLVRHSVDHLDEDVKRIEDFSINMLNNPYLTSYGVPIGCFFVGSIMAVIAISSYGNKKSSFQIMLFLFSGLTLGYIMQSFGLYFSNFSSLNDICESIRGIANKPSLPEGGIGLDHYLRCSQIKPFFQQISVNILAQNAVLKMFNNEMFKMGRPETHSVNEALEEEAYLENIQASSQNLKEYSKLMRTNNKILENLLTINKCNLVRVWVFKAETELCLHASKSLTYIFYIYVIMILLLATTLCCANQGIKILDKVQYIEVMKAVSTERKQYVNTFKVQ